MTAVLTGWDAAVAEALAAPPADVRAHPVYLVQGLRRVVPDAFASPEDALAYVRTLYPTARLSVSRERIGAMYVSPRGDRFGITYTLKPAF